MEIFIYALSNPITNEIRYIGKTNNPKRRLYSHIEEAKRLNGIKSRRSLNWIKSLLNQNLKPKLDIIQICDKNNWEYYEKYWIKYYKDLNFDLCNIEDGGKHSCKNFSEEKKIKDSNFLRNLKSKFSEEDKIKIWKLIHNNISYEEINKDYPNISKSFIYQIKNGYKWNYITNIIKTKRIRIDYSQQRNTGKGYFYNKQIKKFIAVVTIDKKKNILGKFENEIDAISCINNYRFLSLIEAKQ